jgi:AcrR family transcriptional regulator
MSEPGTSVRRRSDGEETRRRVLDAVVQTIVDVGYDKASSNEIARRAGVTWGAIHHLFGSREQLMLEVFHDLGAQFQRRFADAEVRGDTLEERLSSLTATVDGQRRNCGIGAGWRAVGSSMMNYRGSGRWSRSAQGGG